MAVSSVEGAFSIAACSELGLWSIAANVSAILVNSSACTFATGATSAEALPICLKNWLSCVDGSARLRITGLQVRARTG